MAIQKYNNGDRVKVSVGHWIISPTENSKLGKFVEKYNDSFVYDMRPELTEDEATVDYSYAERYGKGDKESSHSYSLKFDKYGSISWFEEGIVSPV